jgi:hypothetical protein
MRAALAILLLTATLTAQGGVRNFDRGCGPVATWPRLAVTMGTPRINTQLTVTGRLLAPSTLAIMAIGLSNTTWGGVNLPLMLDPRPFPPCQLLVDPAVLLFGPTDQNGQRSWSLSIPNDTRLIGMKVYLQMATHAQLLSMTDGLELTIF